MDIDKAKAEEVRLAHRVQEILSSAPPTTDGHVKLSADQAELVGLLAYYAIVIDAKLTAGQSVLPTDWQNEGTLGSCTK